MVAVYYMHGGEHSAKQNKVNKKMNYLIRFTSYFAYTHFIYTTKE